MRHSLRVMLGLGLVLSAAGCSDYLSGPGVASTSDPNNIITLTQPGPLYVSVQQAGPPQRQGQLGRFAAEYTQQIAGVARQQQGFDRYQAAASATDTYFGAVYGASNVLTGGGGLLDVHKMQQLAAKKGDSLFVGIGKVYEALIVGFAADLWGDIPYREAADSTILQPHFDPQLQIYADLQTLLNDALTNLAATGATNAGPAADLTELTYRARVLAAAPNVAAGATALRAVYTSVAHSLKARYFMHVAATDPTAYASALAEAQLGISSNADDFVWYADATTQANNIYWQFNSARTGDIAPGAAIIEILKRRITAGVEDAARIAFYFTHTEDLSYYGARPAGNNPLATNGVIYNGSGSPAGNFSQFASFIDPNISDGSFQLPEITYAETQLIAAEAAWRLNGGGADPTLVVAAAQPFLNAARATRRYGSQTFVGGSPGVLPASLQNIIEEKYVTLFLNPEVWNDYKRTCLPSLAPWAADGTNPGPNPIPGRLPYGLTEINANPNTPVTSSAGVTITSVSLNPNQPASCPVLNYTTSVPLAN